MGGAEVGVSGSRPDWVSRRNLPPNEDGAN
jgi:hypothetical protein